MGSEASGKNGNVTDNELEGVRWWFKGDEETIDTQPAEITRERIATLREEAAQTRPRGLLRQAYLEYRSALRRWYERVRRKGDRLRRLDYRRRQ